jgi:hypothetical protein
MVLSYHACTRSRRCRPRNPGGIKAELCITGLLDRDLRRVELAAVLADHQLKRPRLWKHRLPCLGLAESLGLFSNPPVGLLHLLDLCAIR